MGRWCFLFLVLTTGVAQGRSSWPFTKLRSLWKSSVNAFRFLSSQVIGNNEASPLEDPFLEIEFASYTFSRPEMRWKVLQPLRDLAKSRDLDIDTTWLPTQLFFDKYKVGRSSSPIHFCDSSLYNAETTTLSEAALSSLWSITNLQHDANFLLSHSRSLDPYFGSKSKDWFKKVLFTDADSFKSFLVEEQLLRRSVISDGIEWVWHNLENVSFGAPEINPVNGSAKEDWSSSPVSLIDGIDTVLLSGGKELAQKGVNWLITHNTDLDQQSAQSRFLRRRKTPQKTAERKPYDRYTILPEENVNFFETNIRQLGGLLSLASLWKEETRESQKTVKSIVSLAHTIGSRLALAFGEKVPYSAEGRDVEDDLSSPYKKGDLIAAQRELQAKTDSKDGDSLPPVANGKQKKRPRKKSSSLTAPEFLSEEGLSNSSSESPSDSQSETPSFKVLEAIRIPVHQETGQVKDNKIKRSISSIDSFLAEFLNDEKGVKAEESIQKLQLMKNGSVVPHYCDLIKNNANQSFTHCCKKSSWSRPFISRMIPASDVKLKAGTTWRSPEGYLAEAGTLYLEYSALSQVTGDCSFHDAADAAIELLEQTDSVTEKGVVAVERRPDGYPAEMATESVGCRADSFYEYLIKEWAMTKREDPLLTQMIDSFIRSLPKFANQLPEPQFNTTIGWATQVNAWSLPHGPSAGDVYMTGKSRHWLPASFRRLPSGDLRRIAHNKLEHLVCYFPGLLGLLTINLKLSDPRRAFLQHLSEKFLTSCVAAYFTTPTGALLLVLSLGCDLGLSPEISSIESGIGMTVPGESAQALLRPETLESLMYLAHISNELKYQNWGWRIWLAILSNAKADFGFSSLKSAERSRDFGGFEAEPPRQHTWFLGETMKYLFLLFSDPNDVERRLGITGKGQKVGLENPFEKSAWELEAQKDHWLYEVALSTEGHFFFPKHTSCGRLNRLKQSGCLLKN